MQLPILMPAPLVSQHAAALYDLIDSDSDGYDQADFTFDDIWDTIDSNPPHQTFEDFWNKWKSDWTGELSGEHNHYGVQAIYQNTIPYIVSPVISLPVRVGATVENFPLDNEIDLFVRSSDPESVDALLTWQITEVDNPRCSPTHIDGQYVDIGITSLPNATETCIVTVEVSDGIEMDDGQFEVVILVPTSWIYIPLVQKSEESEAFLTHSDSNPYPPPLSPLPLHPTPMPPYP